MATLCLAAINNSNPSRDKEKACVLLLKNYLGEFYVQMEDYAYKQSIDINEFRAFVVLHAFDKCLLNINSTTVTNYLSWLNETEKIEPVEYPDLVYTPDLALLATNFTFSESNKTWFKDLNALTADVNKEVAAEVRKY